MFLERFDRSGGERFKSLFVLSAVCLGCVFARPAIAPAEEGENAEPPAGMVTREQLEKMVVQKAEAAVAAEADAPEPSAKETAPRAPIRDYSKGFQKFYELGLPCVSNATYVKLELDSYYPGLQQDMMDERSLIGNAWLLKEDKTNASVFVIGSCRIINVHDRKLLEKEREEREKAAGLTADKGSRRGRSVRRPTPDAVADDRIGGEWKPVDLQKDVAKFMARLRKMQKDRSLSYSFSYGNTPGTMLLTAIHWHSQGFTNEANEMVGILFAASKDPRKLITQGVDVLASTRYQEACDHFFKTASWPDYARDMETITTRFSGGWSQVGAARKLLGEVRKQLNSANPPPLVGEGLSPEDQKLALELAGSTNLNFGASYSYGSPGIDWLMPPPRRKPAAAAVTTNALSRILERGLESIPMLIAMIKDDFLLPVDLRGHSGYYSQSYRSSDEPEEVRIEQIYNSMRRPASRGEVATIMLRPLVISGKDSEAMDMMDDDETGSTALRDEFQARCRTWYERIKGKSALDMARLYSAEGDSSQSYRAMLYLLRYGSDTDMAAMEKRFMEAKDLMQSSNLALMYISRRGNKAAEFAQKYEARIKAWNPADSDEYPKEYAKQLTDRLLTQLRMSTSTNSAKEVIQEILTLTNQAPNVLYTYHDPLNRALARGTPEEALTLVLEAALKAEKPDTTVYFMQLAVGVPNLSRYARDRSEAMMMDEYSDEGEAEPDEPREPSLDIKTHAGLWKKLLADTRKPIVRNYRSEMQVYTVGATAAWMIEYLYGRKNDEDMYTFTQTSRELGDRFLDVVQARAAARLEGKEPPPLPSPDNVTPEQRKVLIDRLAAAGGANALRRVFAALTMDEQLALQEESDENETLEAILVPLANSITEIKVKIVPAGDAAKCEALKNSLLTTNAVQALVDVSKRSVAAGRRISCRLSRLPTLKGMSLIVTQPVPATNKTSHVSVPSDPFASPRFRAGGGPPMAMVTGSFNAPDAYANAIWFVTNTTAAAGSPTQPTPPPAAKPTDPGDDDDLPLLVCPSSYSSTDQVDEFWKKLQEFCESKKQPFAGATLTITGTTPSSGSDTPDSDDDDDMVFDEGVPIDL